MAGGTVGENHFAPQGRPDLRRGSAPTAIPGGNAPRATEKFDSNGRRVVRMGLIVDDGENPVWHKGAPEGAEPEVANPASEEEEYDIPTFLRKQAD